jgi:hypothetical protein
MPQSRHGLDCGEARSPGERRQLRAKAEIAAAIYCHPDRQRTRVGQGFYPF